MRSMSGFFVLLFIVCVLTPSANAQYTGEPNPSKQVAPHRLIVKLKTDAAPRIKMNRGTVSVGIPAFDALNQKHGISKMERLFDERAGRRLSKKFSNIMLIEIPDGKDALNLASEYNELEEVEFAEPDFMMQLHAAPNDPYYIHQWAMNNTGQEHYYLDRYEGYFNDTLRLHSGQPDADVDGQEILDNTPAGGRNVIVGVVDFGIDFNHPDIIDVLWTNTDEIPDNGIDDDFNGFVDDVKGWDFSGDVQQIIFEDNDPTDTYGHGTHCAGIIASPAGNNEGIAGIAQNCTIMPVKMFPNGYHSVAAKSILYAVDNGAKILSMSWGSSFSSYLVKAALDYAEEQGVIMVSSSGNCGLYLRTYPASFENVIGVGATDCFDNVTTFTTHGYLSVSAPGLDVLSLRAEGTDMYITTEPDVHIIDEIYYLCSGTSMACPYVAGAAACLLSASPGLTRERAQYLLESTADDMIDPYGIGDSLPGYDIYSGYGRLNAWNALQAIPRVRAAIDSPADNDIVSGVVDIIGLADGAEFADYILEYGFGESPDVWTEITTSSAPVTDGVLAQWDTDGIEGNCVIRLRVGEYNVSSINLHIINLNESRAEILSPNEGDTVITTYPNYITGVAACPDFHYWTLEYAYSYNPYSYTMIDSSNIPLLTDTVICRWENTMLSNTSYTLRLTVYSHTGPAASYSTNVFLQSLFSMPYGWTISGPDTLAEMINYGDFDGDGGIEFLVGTNTTIHFYDCNGNRKTAGMPIVPQHEYLIPPAVGNLDGDGIDDIVAYAYECYECDTSWLVGLPSSGSRFDIKIPGKPGQNDILKNNDPECRPYIYLKDWDGDSLDEIFVYSSKASSMALRKTHFYYIFESDGTQVWETPWADSGHYYYYTADIDNDGTDEIYRAGNWLHRVDMDGNLLDSVSLLFEPDHTEFRTIQMQAVDLDYDSKLELVVFGISGECWEYHPQGKPCDIGGFHYLYAFDENLDPLPGWPRYIGYHNRLNYVMSSPVFCDYDNDNAFEYFATIHDHIHGAFMGWDDDGTPLVESDDMGAGILTELPTRNIISSPVICDTDGDGNPDILGTIDHDYLFENPSCGFAAINTGGEMIDDMSMTIQNGIQFMPTKDYTPLVGDFDEDGHLDILRTWKNKLYFTSLDHPYDSTTTLYNIRKYNRKLNCVCPEIAPCIDTDNDGWGDPGTPGNICPDDNCPLVWNANQSDIDGDGIGDACDECTDPDGDGLGSPGYEASQCPTDNCPDIYNPDQSDIDGDGVGDACDNCPDMFNPNQEDIDGDGIGYKCEDCVDLDGDGYGNPEYARNSCPDDNCPDDYNPDQADSDGNGVGDACDFACGDVNLDGNINLLDATFIIRYLYMDGPEPEPMSRCDVNADGNCNLLDAVTLINYLYQGGPEPICL